MKVSWSWFWALAAAVMLLVAIPGLDAGHGKVKSKCKKHGKVAVSKVRHHRHVMKAGLSACSSGGGCCAAGGCH